MPRDNQGDQEIATIESRADRGCDRRPGRSQMGPRVVGRSRTLEVNMPPLKIITLASLLALAIAAPSAFAQGGDTTPPPPRNAPAISPTPGDSKTAPGDQQR